MTRRKLDALGGHQVEERIMAGRGRAVNRLDHAFVLLGSRHGQDTGMGVRDGFGLGAHAARDNDLAVFRQCLADGSERFRLGAVEEPTRIDDRKISPFVYAGEFITLGAQARDDALAVDQRLGASEGYETHLRRTGFDHSGSLSSRFEELIPGRDNCKPIGHKSALQLQRLPMKVVLYPFRRDDAIIQLTSDFPDLDWAVVSSAEELAREICDAAILVTSNRVCTPAYGEALQAHAKSLRWMFFSSSGIERGVAAGIPAGVRVSNSTGVKATMVAEHAMTLLLALLRQLPECQALQRAHLYRRQETNGKLKTLEDATVCVIGRGAIGREIVRKLKAFDAQPIAVSRAATDPGDLAAVYP